MEYDSLHSIWYFLNLISRPDVLMTELGSELAAPVLFLSVELLYIAWAFALAFEYSIMKSRVKKVREQYLLRFSKWNNVVCSIFFYCSYIPLVF
jgi:hypothetical protein